MKESTISQDIRNIRSLHLDRNRKWEILSTYLRTIVAKSYNRKTKNTTILNYKVYFDDFEILKYLFKEVFLLNTYYFHSENGRPIVFDCGSNIGMSVLYFKWLYPDSQIEAFEPSDAAFAYLERNVERNGLKGVNLHNVALTKEKGTVELFYDSGSPTGLRMTTVRDRLPKQSKRVAAVQLSEFVSTYVDMLKMDIEGAETDVLEELEQAGKLTSVRHLILEYHHHINKDEDKFSETLHLLERNNFGYHISARPLRMKLTPTFQDILIYAYRKNDRNMGFLS